MGKDFRFFETDPYAIDINEDGGWHKLLDAEKHLDFRITRNNRAIRQGHYTLFKLVDLIRNTLDQFEKYMNNFHNTEWCRQEPYDIDELTEAIKVYSAVLHEIDSEVWIIYE